MKTIRGFSEEEIEAIEEMGGWGAVRNRADSILREYGITRSLLGSSPEPWKPRELKFYFDPLKSMRAPLDDLFTQATKLQRKPWGTKYLDTMLLHLVGSKLDLLLGQGIIKHRGVLKTSRVSVHRSCFEVSDSVIYVTSCPREALIRKACANLTAGRAPIIITTADGVSLALLTLKGTEWADRIDVLEVGQFLTANIFERSLFRVTDCKVTLKNIIERYNLIVERCETDPVLRIRL